MATDKQTAEEQRNLLLAQEETMRGAIHSGREPFSSVFPALLAAGFPSKIAWLCAVSEPRLSKWALPVLFLHDPEGLKSSDNGSSVAAHAAMAKNTCALEILLGMGVELHSFETPGNETGRSILGIMADGCLNRIQSEGSRDKLRAILWAAENGIVKKACIRARSDLLASIARQASGHDILNPSGTASRVNDLNSRARSAFKLILPVVNEALACGVDLSFAAADAWRNHENPRDWRFCADALTNDRCLGTQSQRLEKPPAMPTSLARLVISAHPDSGILDAAVKSIGARRIVEAADATDAWGRGAVNWAISNSDNNHGHWHSLIGFLVGNGARLSSPEFSISPLAHAARMPVAHGHSAISQSFSTIRSIFEAGSSGTVERDELFIVLLNLIEDADNRDEAFVSTAAQFLRPESSQQLLSILSLPHGDQPSKAVRTEAASLAASAAMASILSRSTTGRPPTKRPRSI